MLRDGFYKVAFSAGLPGAGGIVVLENGAVRGGDNQMLYSGAVSFSGSDPSGPVQMTADLAVRSYVVGANSVFNAGSSPFKLALTGTAQGESFSLRGPSPFGGQGITIAGDYLAPLDF